MRDYSRKLENYEQKTFITPTPRDNHSKYFDKFLYEILHIYISYVFVQYHFISNFSQHLKLFIKIFSGCIIFFY